MIEKSRSTSLALATIAILGQTPETSVEWGLKCVDFYFRQSTIRCSNVLLQRIVTQPELKSGVL